MSAEHETRWWVSTAAIGKPGVSPKTAGPFTTRDDAFAARKGMEALGANLSVFEEAVKPAVSLPSKPTLGWLNNSPYLLATWKASNVLGVGGATPISPAPFSGDHITAFTPATAVPTHALESLRKVRASLDGDYPAVDAFLAAVDEARA